MSNGAVCGLRMSKRKATEAPKVKTLQVDFPADGDVTRQMGMRIEPLRMTIGTSLPHCELKARNS